MLGTVCKTVFESLSGSDLKPSNQGRGWERPAAVQLCVSSAINKWHINMSNSEIIVLEKVRM